MCDAEEELRNARADLVNLHRAFDQLVEFAADVDRGIITTEEFRRQAQSLSSGRGAVSIGALV